MDLGPVFVIITRFVADLGTLKTCIHLPNPLTISCFEILAGTCDRAWESAGCIG